MTGRYPTQLPAKLTKADTLYVCPACLEFFLTREELVAHSEGITCPGQPPGPKIYQSSYTKGRRSGAALRRPRGESGKGGQDDEGIPYSIWEVDGGDEKLGGNRYAANLVCLSKLFFEWTGVLISDAACKHYNFFVATTPTDQDFVGYFSCPKLMPGEIGFSLCCVLVLPVFRKKGFGRLL